MFNLTKQERMVLILLSVILFAGSLLQYVFKKNPHLDRIIDVIEGDRAFLKVDINTATVRELVEIPYIGKTRAEQILKYRQRVRFQRVEQLREVKGIGPATYKKISPFVKVRK